MKKKSALLFIVPACALLMAGCDAKSGLLEVKKKAKEIVYKTVEGLDNFFEEESQTNTAVKASYHL